MFKMALARTRSLNPTAVLLLLASVVSCATVISTPAIEAQFKQRQGFVSDFADKLSSGVKQELEALLRAYADRNGIDFAVVLVPFGEMHGQPIEDYSLALGREWGIGRGPQNLGLLLLIAVDSVDTEGRFHGSTRLEVSRNLERDIPNELSSQIIRTMRADFQAGRFDQAVKTGVKLILTTLSEKRRLPK